MRIIFVLLALFWTAIAGNGIVLAQEVGASQARKLIEQLKSAPKRGLFFEAKKGTSTVYLFGTAHFGKMEYYPLNWDVVSAESSSKALVLELDLKELTNAEVHGQLARYSADERRSTKRGPALTRLLERFNISPGEADTFRPWFLATRLSALCAAELGFDPTMNSESFLVGIATSQRKRIVGLETMREALSLFTDLTLEDQESFLDEAVRRIDSGEHQEMIRQQIGAWAKASKADIEAAMAQGIGISGDLGRRVEKRMFADRNARFAAKIDEFAGTESPIFVGVGVGHLVGPRSLVEILEEQGYTIRER